MSSAFLQVDTLNEAVPSKGGYNGPMSPGSKGEGTTVSTERDTDLTGGQNVNNQYSSMLQDRRSLSLGSAHEFASGELTSSHS